MGSFPPEKGKLAQNYQVRYTGCMVPDTVGPVKRIPNRSPPTNMNTSRTSTKVSLDAGNSSIKLFDGSQLRVIPSYYVPNPKGFQKTDTESPRIQYGNEVRWFSKSAALSPQGRSFWETDKATQLLWALFATLPPIHTSIDLVFSHWDHTRAADLQRSLDGVHSYTYNGTLRTVQVTSTMVLEGQGTHELMQRSGCIGPGSTCIVELGHGTSEVLSYEQGELVDFQVTGKWGMVHLAEALATQIQGNRISSGAPQDMNLKALTLSLVTGEPPYSLTSEQWATMVREQSQIMGRRILKALSEPEFESYRNIVLCGGGAQILANAFPELKEHVRIPTEPAYSSVIGALYL